MNAHRTDGAAAGNGASPNGSPDERPGGNGSTPVTLTRKDFSSDQELRWCPGCGDYGIAAALQLMLPDLGIEPHDMVFVSGIGCAARLPYYMNTYGVHSIHGRAPAVATGVAIVLWGQVLDDGTTAFRMTSITFAAALLTLAILEHGFMMLPLPSERLWDWGLRSRTATARRSGGRGPTSAGG